MADRATLKWARALTLASVILATGLSGHVAAGGDAPPAALVVPLLMVLVCGVAPFLDAPASPWRVVVLVLAAQGLLHVAFGLLASSTTAQSSPTTMLAAPGHDMSHLAPLGDDSAPSALSTVFMHPSMHVAHLGAALLVALWLAAGERAAWTLVGVASLAVVEAWLIVRDAGFAVAAAVAARSVRPRPKSAWTGRPPRMHSVWVGRGGLSRRGPPPVCATA